MPRLLVTTRDGEERVVEAAAGQTVMEAMRDGGISDVLALCGGVCSCGTCHVYVDSGPVAALPVRGEDEGELLEYSDHCRENSRLGCQIPFTDDLDGLRVTVAPED